MIPQNIVDDDANRVTIATAYLPTIRRVSHKKYLVIVEKARICLQAALLESTLHDLNRRGLLAVSSDAEPGSD